MVALLGLLAVAGYQNRSKIAEVLGGKQGRAAARLTTRPVRAGCSTSWAGSLAVRAREAC